MKSTVLLATGACISLAVAQSPTTWTTITIYSTTTEYVNSTSTATLYSSSSLVSSDSTTASTTFAMTTTVPSSSSDISTAVSSTSSSSTESIPESVSTTTTSQTRVRASATAPFGVSVGILSSLSSTSDVPSSTSSSTSSSSSFSSPSAQSTIPSVPSPSASSAASSAAVSSPSASLSSPPSSSTTSTSPLPTSTAFTLDVVRINDTSDTYEPVVAHNSRLYIGLNTTETCASTAASNCTTPTASFSSGNGTMSLTNRASAPQTVYIGPVGGLRYTSPGQPSGMQNGSTTTGFAVKGSGMGSIQISNVNGALYACPRPNLGASVAQIFVGTSRFAREDCWQVNAFGTMI